MNFDLDKTIAYYNQHATEYFAETVQVDLGEQRDVFLSAAGYWILAAAAAGIAVIF